MRWPRRKHPRPIRLGGLRTLLFRKVVLDGERYIVTRVGYDNDPYRWTGVHLELQAEASFRAQHEVRATRRRVADVLRRRHRHQHEDGSDAA